MARKNSQAPSAVLLRLFKRAFCLPGPYVLIDGIAYGMEEA